METAIWDEFHNKLNEGLHNTSTLVNPLFITCLKLDCMGNLITLLQNADDEDVCIYDRPQKKTHKQTQIVQLLNLIIQLSKSKSYKQISNILDKEVKQLRESQSTGDNFVNCINYILHPLNNFSDFIYDLSKNPTDLKDYIDDLNDKYADTFITVFFNDYDFNGTTWKPMGAAQSGGIYNQPSGVTQQTSPLFRVIQKMFVFTNSSKVKSGLRATIGYFPEGSKYNNDHIYDPKDLFGQLIGDNENTKNKVYVVLTGDNIPRSFALISYYLTMAFQYIKAQPTGGSKKINYKQVAGGLKEVYKNNPTAAKAKARKMIKLLKNMQS